MNKEYRLCLPIVHVVHTHEDGGDKKKEVCNGLTALKQSMCEIMLQPWLKDKNTVGFQGELPLPSPEQGIPSIIPENSNSDRNNDSKNKSKQKKK